jgi:hypothetical protein
MDKQVDFDRKAVGEVDVDFEDAGIWKCVLQKAVKCGITEKALVKRESETAGNLRVIYCERYMGRCLGLERLVQRMHWQRCEQKSLIQLSLTE